MNWLRKPRLNSAVATVAVLMVFSLSRVSVFKAMTISLIDRRFGHGRAEARFQEIEVATFVGLLDVLGEHPAVAAFIARLGFLPGGAALGQLLVRDVHVDGALIDIERDHVAGAHQRQW